MARRTTIYAAFDGGGKPAINVFSWNKKELATRIADRISNGEALVGEHLVHITVAKYNSILSSLGLQPICAANRWVARR